MDRVPLLRLLCSLLLLSPLLLDSATARGFQAQAGQGRWRKRLGKLMVKASADPSAPGTSDGALAKLGLKKAKNVGSRGWALLDIQDGEDVTAKVEMLQSMGYTAEYDWIVNASVIPADAAWSSISTAMNSISAPLAWNISTGTSAVTVCVIDTGISQSHPDLRANAIQTLSYNAITNRESATAGNDDNSHGTHCSGTIGGVANNGVGVAGVSWGVKLLACKFLDSSGSGSTSAATNCVKWCREKGAKITSNSWGRGGYSQTLGDEIQRSQVAGHLFVAAAGNSGQNIDSSPSYPAAYSQAAVISVGASDPATERPASFSNFGVANVDLFAPGVNIYSTVPTAKTPSGYATYSGTSMACPHVAGAAALLWSYKPSLTAAQVKKVLMDSVDPISFLSGKCVTGGRLNILKALQSVGSGDPVVTPSPPPPPPPSPPPTLRVVGRNSPCGPGALATCSSPLCCSRSSICGTRLSGACGSGCQRGYGLCN